MVSTFGNLAQKLGPKTETQTKPLRLFRFTMSQIPVDCMDTIVYPFVKGGDPMNFYSVRDLRTDSKTMWSALRTGDEIVLTNNGKPSALMIDIPDGCFDEIVQAVRQAKAMIAVNNMRRRAAREGFRSDEEIEALIDEVRNGSTE